jgi:hypothetical protein
MQLSVIFAILGGTVSVQTAVCAHIRLKCEAVEWILQPWPMRSAGGVPTVHTTFAEMRMSRKTSVSFVRNHLLDLIDLVQI